MGRQGILWLMQGRRYSLFPKELMPVPRAWAEKTGNLVSFAEHDKGASLFIPIWRVRTTDYYGV